MGVERMLPLVVSAQYIFRRPTVRPDKSRKSAVLLPTFELMQCEEYTSSE